MTCIVSGLETDFCLLSKGSTSFFYLKKYMKIGVERCFQLDDFKIKEVLALQQFLNSIYEDIFWQLRGRSGDNRNWTKVCLGARSALVSLCFFSQFYTLRGSVDKQVTRNYVHRLDQTYKA